MSNVAVIIPTFNRAALLSRAVASVKAQTFRDIEIIVVDDGSTDETAAICGDLPAIRYIRLAHSGLPAVVRNAGITASDSEFVAFLDSDDEWLPNKLQTQISRLRQDSALALICGNAVQMTEGADIARSVPYHRAMPQGDAPFNSLLKENFVIASTVALRRSAVDRIGLFSEDPELRGLEDYDLWLRIAATHRMSYIPDIVARYWLSGDGISRRQSSVAHWAGILRIFHRLSSLPGFDDKLRSTLNSEINRCWSTLCDACILQGQYVQFGKRFAQYVWTSPAAAMSYLHAGVKKVRKQ